MKMSLPIAIANIVLVLLVIGWIYHNFTLLPIQQSLLEVQFINLLAWFLFDVDQKSLTWNRFGWIIRNKIGIWLVVFVCHELDLLLFSDAYFVEYTVCLFFFAIEALSVMTLLQKIEINIPSFLLDKLEQLRDDSDKKDHKD